MVSSFIASLLQHLTVNRRMGSRDACNRELGVGLWGCDGVRCACVVNGRTAAKGLRLRLAFVSKQMLHSATASTSRHSRHRGIVARLQSFFQSTHTHTGKNLSVVGQKHTLPWPCQQLFASRPSRAVPNRTGKADAPPKFLCRLLLPIGKRIPCISRFGFASSLTVLAGVSSVVPSRADVCVSLFEFSLSHLPGNAFNYPRASYADCAYLEQIFTR